MNENSKKRKALALSLALAAMLSASVAASAQGLFGNQNGGEPHHNGSLLNREGNASGSYGISTNQFGSGTEGGYNITTNQFGQNQTPLGSGWLILTIAGAGYALKKRTSKKQLN